MPNRRISDGEKWIAIRGLALGYNEDDILELVDFSESTLRRTLKQYQEIGTVTRKKPFIVGRPRELHREDVNYLLSLAHHSPQKFLDEYQALLYQNRAIHISLSTIHRTFEREGISYKRIAKNAAERDPWARADFVRRVGLYPIEYLVFVDETSKDERTYFRNYGRSLKNMPCEVAAPFIRGHRFSLLPAMDMDGIFAYKVVEGSFTRDLFMEFLREHVLPLTRSFPGPRSVIIMDNARIHHSDEITELVEEVYGCRIEYLPAYSPDYNPIEQAFAVIKKHIRHQGKLFEYSDSPQYELYTACDEITPDHALSFFYHSGYHV